MSVPTELHVFHTQARGWSFQVPLHVSVQCLGCRHRTSAVRCAAFPDGIPKPILTGDVDHSAPVEGDHGIQYEPTADGAVRPSELDRLLDGDLVDF